MTKNEQEWQKLRQDALNKWKRGVDRDLERYYELNPHKAAEKPGKKSGPKSR